MKKKLKAVFSPQKFTPSLISRQHEHENLWESNRPYVLSNMAHMAYFNEQGIRKFAQALGAERTHYYDSEGAQAFLAVWETRAILSFRGSQPKEDPTDDVRSGLSGRLDLRDFDKLRIEPWSMRLLSNDVRADLEFRKVPFDDSATVEVHAGFLKEINKVWNVIRADIEDIEGTVPVWVTGHSLGAAMATLAGMRHAFEGVTTFGEPRVGIGIGQVFRSKSHTRYVNGKDPVTMVPPEKVFGYEHHGSTEKISDQDGREDPKYDHSIVYYSENLAQKKRPGSIPGL